MPKRVLSSELPKRGTWVALADNESHHALNVMRLSDGDQVEVLDGNGHHIFALLRIRKGQAYLEHLDAPQSLPNSENSPPALTKRILSPPICLEMAILKGDAMEWVVEKAVELGVNDFIPVSTIRSVVQVKAKGPEFFQQRWQKIADQALKQCGRLERMVVHPPISLEKLIFTDLSEGTARLWCDEARTAETPEILEWLQFHLLQLSKGVRILVGPEGGWDPAEREWLEREIQGNEHHRISLGSFVLRAETAALFAISLAAACRKRK